MPCPECPETPDTGCLQPITTECVTYDGNDIDCADISSGQSLNQVIEQLANNDCDLQEQIEDIVQDIEELSGNVNNLQDDLEELSGSVQTQINNIPTFSCEDLSGCSIDDLLDVDVSPASGDGLIFNGIKWVNYTPEIIDTFSCSDLSGCTLDNLGNVVETSSTSGQVLGYDGTNWVNLTLPAGTNYSSSNGITEVSDNFKLGGALVENTTITGNFDLIFGTSSSALDDFKIYANKVLARGTTISLSETGDDSTQTKGFLYKTAGTSISLGTTVFDDFSTYGGVYRIGSNITLDKTGLLDPAGFFMGTNISVDSSPAYALGGDITLENFLGFVIGITNTASGYAGGFIMGSEIDLSGGATGNQSAYLFGSKIDVGFGAGVAQGALVFNPTNVQINSSSTGNSANEKIRVDVSNGFITTFNASDYYFFTDVTNTAGWNVNTDIVRFNKNFVQISQSTGTVAEEKIGCIRYNSGTDKYQGYTTATGWADLH